MAEILGLGITHYPNLAFQGDLNRRIHARLKDRDLPDAVRSPESWPDAMRDQWGDDEGDTHGEAHRAEMIAQFRKYRAILDGFQPDLCVIWGDDQYELFREDCVPAFCVLAYDSVDVQPFLHSSRGVNYWNEPADKTFTIRGDRNAGRRLTTGLLNEGFDVAYAYRPSERPLGHAFVNSVLYLDWDRAGFPYPVIPFTINCYGSALLGQRVHEEGIAGIADPPSPSPRRCFDIGAATYRVLSEFPGKIALIASSSWSHSFLTRKHATLYPDVESDRRYFEALREGEWETWRSTTLEELEDRGHHELLNWFCLAGAMAERGRKPDETVFLESWLSTSDKTFAVFRP